MEIESGLQVGALGSRPLLPVPAAMRAATGQMPPRTLGSLTCSGWTLCLSALSTSHESTGSFGPVELEFRHRRR